MIFDISSFAWAFWDGRRRKRAKKVFDIQSNRDIPEVYKGVFSRFSKIHEGMWSLCRLKGRWIFENTRKSVGHYAYLYVHKEVKAAHTLEVWTEDGKYPH